MEKPKGRKSKRGATWSRLASLPRYPSDLPTNMSVGHSRWARTADGGGVVCMLVCSVFQSVCECRACPEPRAWQAEGIGRHPQRSAAVRHRRAELDVASSHARRAQGLHATPHNMPPLVEKNNPLTQSMHHAFTSLTRSRSPVCCPHQPSLLPPSPSPLVKNHFSQYKQPCIRAKRVSSV